MVLRATSPTPTVTLLYSIRNSDCHHDRSRRCSPGTCLDHSTYENLLLQTRRLTWQWRFKKRKMDQEWMETITINYMERMNGWSVFFFYSLCIDCLLTIYGCLHATHNSYTHTKMIWCLDWRSRRRRWWRWYPRAPSWHARARYSWYQTESLGEKVS